MSLPVIVVGGGGHAKVVLDALLAIKRQILGFCDPDENGDRLAGVKRLGGDESILQFAAANVALANGIGMMPFRSLRREVHEKFSSKGYRFERIIHPSAVVGSDVALEDGVQVMAGVVIQPGTCVGKNSIINTSASIDHDCIIGAHVHIAPGATLCGHVQIGENAHVGCGATIIQNITVGNNSVIGAGAVVLRDVPPNSTVVGIPARAVENRSALK